MLFVPTTIRGILILAVLCATAAGQIDPASEPTVTAVGKVLPAVVNINTERIVSHTVRDPFDALFYQYFGGPMRPPREFRQKVQSLGSGFLVDPSGYIVTNEHVVERAADLKIQVTMTDGATYSARYIVGDPKTDLAFIKIEGKAPFPCISLENLSPSLLGQTVLALGNPLGYGVAVSRGILSALNRTITVDENEYSNLIQTDAAINPGNSGGPLIDISGRLVGVSSVKMAYTPQGVPTQGMGFGISAATVRDKVVEFRRVARGQKVIAAGQGTSLAQRYFGLQVQDLTRELTDAFGYEPGAGVLISDVEQRSPAGEAGLRRGLVIYKVGNYDVNSKSTLEELLARVKPGVQADFTVGVIVRLGGQYQHQVRTISLRARETN
jgi:S1-C subfamily serine protease